MSLTVVYGPRRFKVPVTPGTLLGQVRDEVCTGQNGLNLKSSEFGLAHHGKSLDLTLPFRLANLVNNAHVELVRARQPETVRVKIRAPRSPDFVGEFARSTSIAQVLETARLQGQLLLNNVAVKPDTELASLGGTGGILFVLDPKAHTATPHTATPHTAAPHTATPHTQAMTHTTQATTQATPLPATQGSGVSSRGEREAVVTQAVRPEIAEDEPPEMDTRQFTTYYQHLRQQAEPPMVSKSTQARLQGQKPVEATTVRIRFPDENLLEGKFAAGEAGADVYAFVKMYLRQSATFELVSMKPQFVLQPTAELATLLGSRALLVFRPGPGHKAPFLNDKALALARPPPSQAPGPSGTQGPQARPATKAEEKTKEEKTKESKFKIKPKWLKLHK